jgi:hypothetical protein
VRGLSNDAERHQYETFLLQLAEDNRFGISAVVRTVTSLGYGFAMWIEEPASRDSWAQRVISYLEVHSCPVICETEKPRRRDSAVLSLPFSFRSTINAP